MAKVLVTGATGFLGSRLVERLAGSFRVVSTSRTRTPGNWPAPHELCDLLSPYEAEALFFRVRPDFVVHCAAMSSVRLCEEEKKRAFGVNAAAARLLARLSEKTGAGLAFISTDLVFDGSSPRYDELSEPAPVSEYGRTKLAGERGVAAAKGKHIILRAALLYDYPPVPFGNFFAATLESLAAGRPVDLFVDQFRTPLLSDDVGRAVSAWIGMEKRPTGLFHLAGPDRLSRHEMGLILAKELGVSEELVRPVEMAEGFAPRDVSLAAGRIEPSLGIRATPYREGVRAVVARFRGARG